MSLKGTHKILEGRAGPAVSVPNGKKQMTVIDTVIELVCIASAAFGPFSVLERVFGNSEITFWVGAALGLLAAVIVWMAFVRANDADSEKDFLHRECKKAEEQRDYMERELHRALRMMSDEQKVEFCKRDLVE